MKVLSYGIGKKNYTGKISVGMVSRAEALIVFPPNSMTVIYDKRYFAENGYVVNFGYEKNFKEVGNMPNEVKTLIEKILNGSETYDKAEFGPDKNSGYYIIVDDKKIFVKPGESWGILAGIVGLNEFIKEDSVDALNKIKQKEEL